MTAGKDARAVRERYEQAMVDADIEGLARSPALEAIVAGWDVEGIDDAERLRRLRAYFAGRRADLNAAE
jgi:hypothetical protein